MILKSLQWRLVTIFISITVVLMVSVGVTLNKSVEALYYNNFIAGIQQGFENWSIRESDNPSAENILAELRDSKSAAIFLIIGELKSYTIVSRKDNTVFFSSDISYDEANKGEFFSEIIKSDNLVAAMAGKEGNKRKLVHYGERDYFDYAKSLGDYILYFRYDRVDSERAVKQFNTIILNSLLMAIVASLIIGYILSKTITIPIIGMMHKAKKVAAGEFDQVLEVRSDDEIGKLTSTFNYMAGELKNKLAEISSEKNKIETILNYMTDGVIAFNTAGEVIHANPASKLMLGVEEVNRNFNDFSREYSWEVNIEELLYFQSPDTREKNIMINEKFIRIYFALFTDTSKKAGGVIAVLQDITEQQKLENMRREFVANVSHELRTPLTSIKSYAETLLDGALEDRETAEKFLGVIDSEADRMTRLVKDLLQLSRLDNQQMSWNMQHISFVNLVKSCVEKLQMEAENKGHRLESFTIGDIPDIKADKDRIEQVVLNLLSNAIKYTPGGGKITVYIGKMYSDVYVKVADTGIGIPKEDLSRIFERFYRVDKARSREMGGTGLGLSIAREIVEAHGGTISITSEFGKGTEVTARLPINNE